MTTLKPNLTLLQGLAGTQETDPFVVRFRDGLILAWDQSLSNTGVVLVECHGVLPLIRSAMTIRPKGSANGHEGAIQKGISLWREATQVMVYHPEAELVNETPPRGSRVKGGGESSLMGAFALHIAAATFDREVTMIGAQKAKAWICGNPNAEKIVAHAALKEKYGHLPGFHHVTNEHTRDALMVALTRLKEN